jgi:hypothetical protein
MQLIVVPIIFGGSGIRNTDHSSIPKKFGVPISKGLGAVHCQRPAIFFCADCRRRDRRTMGEERKKGLISKRLIQRWNS